MKKTKTSKKLLCLLLSLAMLITMIPGMAFADTSEGSTQVIKRAELFDKNTPIDVVLKKSENDAVTCVCPDTKSFHLRVYANDKDKYTKLYHFDEKSNKWVTETAWNMPTKNEAEEGYYSISLFTLTKAKYVSVGSKHKFKIEVHNTKSSTEPQETYYFNLIRSVGLSELTAAGEDGQQLAVVKQSDKDQYNICCADDKIKLVCTAKTPAYAKIKIDDKEISSGEEVTIDLTKYSDNDAEQKTIPFKVEYKGTEGSGKGTDYIILVDKKDYTPQVTTSYTGAEPVQEDVGIGDTSKAIGCAKDAEVKMKVNVTAPDGSSLSYQWYSESDKNGSGSWSSKAIENATEAEYSIPTKYAGNTIYYCKVTNTVNETKFITESEKCMVRVKPTYASPAKITSQSTNAEVLKGQTCYNLTVTAESMDLGGEPKYQWYISEENNTTSGDPVANGDKATVTVDASNVGTYYYYCAVSNSLEKEDGMVDTSAAVYTTPIEVKIIDTASFFDGEGTEANPFLIKEAEDFINIKDAVAKGNSFADTYLKIMPANGESIKMPESWEPIGTLKVGFTETKQGTGVLPFSGHLDGNGCTIVIPEGGKPLFRYVRDAYISNMKIYGESIDGAGLIDEYFVDYGEDGNYNTGVPDTVTIDNVTLLSGSKTKKSGLIHGNASGKNNIYITNSVVEENVIIGCEGKESAVGSFAGCLNGSIINCKSAAKVYGVSSVGGIAGEKGQSMGICSVLNCEFTGEVHASENYAGGMIGSGYDGKGTAPNTPVVSIRNCLVSGTIEGKNKLGGILGGEPGCENCWANGSGGVTDNVFCGSIHATEENATVGAIVGFMKSYNTNQEVNSNYFLDTCGAINGVGAVEIVHDSDFDITKTGTSVTAQELQDNSVVEKLNSSSTSYKNWIQGENYPVHSSEPVAYQLEISGEYKSTYTIGEALNLAGIKVKANFSDGSSREVDISDIEVAGYDKTKRGIQAIKLAYGAASSTINVKVLKPDTGTITVSLTLLGDTKHGDDPAAGVHTLADGNLTTWMMKTSYEVGVNATVLDVLEKALGEGSILMDNPSGNYIKSLTKDGVKLGETDNGSNSGWMFTINGVHGNLGVAEQYLENGDEVVFHYTDDYTKENWDSGKTASEVIALIDALPEPDMLTLADAAAVAAANDGFSSLSDEDKTMVSQLKQDKLAAAVLKMAELRNASLSTFKDAFKTTGDYLAEILKGNETFGTEWPVIGLARADRTADMDAAEYYADVEKTVEENGSSKLHASKSTENSRTILALTAIGKDVTDVAGYNLLEPLADLNYLKKQGINGPIWALIALDSHNYEIPEVSEEGVQATRENIIETILAAELEDGGWALSGETADPDMTAMAIQALAPYYSGNAQVEVAVDKALDCLSALQNADGGYTSWGTTNSESCAQVVVALTALGINPADDLRFVKNGNSVMDALLGFYVEGGGFSHTLDGEVNGMATEQGYYALASYARMQAGKTSLYDMSDVTIGKAEEGNPPGTQGGETESGKTPATGDESMPSGWSLLALAAGAGILMTRKKKNAA